MIYSISKSRMNGSVASWLGSGSRWDRLRHNQRMKRRRFRSRDSVSPPPTHELLVACPLQY
ncbi:MAG: hypothetical protein KDJ65_21520 [Anaerolineae bacterium]|nr:hypothetical protein [Anaerolineae bacterium]